MKRVTAVVQVLLARLLFIGLDGYTAPRVTGRLEELDHLGPVHASVHLHDQLRRLPGNTMSVIPRRCVITSALAAESWRGSP